MEEELKRYEVMIKAARLRKMKAAFEQVSLEENCLFGSGLSGQRLNVGQGRVDHQARRREMFKLLVGNFKRGDAADVMNSVANFNVVLKVCGLEAVVYLESDGTDEHCLLQGSLQLEQPLTDPRVSAHACGACLLELA